MTNNLKLQNQCIDQYLSLLAEVDAWFRQSMRACNSKIACVEGCSSCCRGLFDITMLDAALLQRGFRQLSSTHQSQVLVRVEKRVQQLQQQWPEFAPPFVLNHLPHEQWLHMPEDDSTRCPLLGEDGLCMVYEHRPLTCRLHGLPQIDLNGDVLCDSYCTLNFKGCDPLSLIELRGDFNRIFQREVALLSQFSFQLIGRNQAELDTFIPTALLIDFDHFPPSPSVTDET